jgi:hypothetical protein
MGVFCQNLFTPPIEPRSCEVCKWHGDAGARKQLSMSRTLILFALGSMKVGPAGLETTQARGRGRPRVGARIDYSVAVPTPKMPVGIIAWPPPKKEPDSAQKPYPLRMIRKVLRNNHGSASIVDLQLLRSIRWPA